MKKSHLLLSTLSAVAAVGALSLTACSSDDSTTTDQGDSGVIDSGPIGTGDGSADSGPQTPAPPALGAQIDRFGRPAINTALNNSFNPDKTSAGAAKDGYNSDQGVATWPATYQAEFAKNLAILDSADGTCGNQKGYVQGSGYALAPALADDRLYINTTGTTCTTYLAVEANALHILTNTDCGGRRPNDDVIDESYSLLAAGILAGVTDGVDAPATPATTTFPYLVAPH